MFIFYRFDYTRGMHLLAATLAVVGALLFSAGSAWADFDDGVAAYDRGDFATALREFRTLAEQGHANAQYYLGSMHYDGIGVTKNDAEAVKWFRRAAKQGHVWSQHNIGFVYEYGIGVTKNDAEAVKWYRKAAEQGHAPAQNNLSVMYAKGAGVPKDYVKAHMWASLAKAQDINQAAAILDHLKERMTAADISKAQALATNWQQASSQQGYQKEEQNVDLEAERKVLNEKLAKIVMETINWTPVEISEGTLDNPGPPISQTCPPDVAKRIQEVSEEEFTKLMNQIGGDLVIAISNRLSEKLSLSQIRLSIEALENFSGWSDNERKEFQESELGKIVQQIVKPAIVESLKFIGPKFGQLATKTFQDIEKKLKTEDITKVSEHNWCLQD